MVILAGIIGNMDLPEKFKCPHGQQKTLSVVGEVEQMIQFLVMNLTWKIFEKDHKHQFEFYNFSMEATYSNGYESKIFLCVAFK